MRSGTEESAGGVSGVRSVEEVKNLTSDARSRVIGVPILIVGIVWDELKVSKSSLEPKLKFWSGSTRTIGILVPGFKDCEPSPIVKVGVSKEMVAEVEPVRTERDVLSYVIEPVWPLGASFKIPKVDWLLSSTLSKIPEFGTDSTNVRISEKTLLPSETLSSGCSSLVCNSSTGPKLIESLPLSSNPKVERWGTKSTKPNPPFAESEPLLSNAW